MIKQYLSYLRFYFKKSLGSKNRWFLFGLLFTLVLIVILISSLFVQVQAAPQTTQVKIGNILVTVPATGQLSSQKEVELRSKIQGYVEEVRVKNNDKAEVNDVLVVLENDSAGRSLAQARLLAESAKIDFEKAKELPDEYTLIKARNSLSEVQAAKKKAYDDLKNRETETFRAISASFADLPDIVSGLDEIIFGTSLNSDFAGWDRNIGHYVDPTDGLEDGTKEEIRQGIEKKFRQAKSDYKEALTVYGEMESQNSNREIQDALADVLSAVSSVSEVVKAVDHVTTKAKDKLEANGQEVPVSVSNHLLQIENYSSLINSHLVTLQQAETQIKDSLATLSRTEELIVERTAFLRDLEDGPKLTDVRQKEITWEQRELGVSEAEKNLADYFIRSPLSGVVGSVGVVEGDYVPEGAAVARIVSPHMEIRAMLNELDAASVRVGQPALVYVDALGEEALAGEVVEVGYLGQVNQGVTNYEVRVAVPVDNKKARPGMNGWVEIVTDKKSNVPVLPNAAVKKDDQGYFVRVLTGAGRNQSVTVRRISVGLSDDENTEILSGLSSDDLVVIGDI